MKKFFKRLAVLSLILGGLSFASAEEPTLQLSPVGGSVITVLPGEYFFFTIIYTNTDVLAVYADDEYQYETLSIPDEKRNVATENRAIYGDIIHEYNVSKIYTAIAISNLGEYAFESITYETTSHL